MEQQQHKWWDLFKLFGYATTEDPISRSKNKNFTGAGVSQPDAIPNMKQNDGLGGVSATLQFGANEFVDLSSVSNRNHRYKEYERIRSIPEVEMAMTVFADEACFSGDTTVITPNGPVSLEKLAELPSEEKYLVYCYDFNKQDYTLGWAYNARKTKRSKTIKVILDDGTHFICTKDHRILKLDEQWSQAGDLKTGDKLMPFYRVNVNKDLNDCKNNIFPRIYTKSKGWINEKQFFKEWIDGEPCKEMEDINKYCRLIAQGLGVRKISEIVKTDIVTVRNRLKRNGFTNAEMKWLGNKSDHRKVVAVMDYKEIDVYDISVEKHQNFATSWGIAHNCQKDDKNRVFTINTDNTEVKKELEFLMFHKKMLNFNQRNMWNLAKQLFIFGDFFYEIVIDVDKPSDGIMNLVPLPPESIFRIETTKGRLIEFQQSKEGPDYQSLARVDVTNATDSDFQQCTAIRFHPDQIVHIKIGEDRQTFYPYGVSLLEPARAPAYQLKMMEDAMMVYRLTRAPERRVFYIDVNNVPAAKAEGFMERMKDMLKKKKVAENGKNPGASTAGEKWHNPTAEEDFWIPIRENSNTRIETLPGAQNLGEIDDTVYFRNKLFTALNFPKNYFNSEDVQTTRMSISSNDVRFARLVERLQSHIEDALMEICDRHLKLMGFPEESYEDLTITLTPPSDYREIIKSEVMMNRLNNASTLKNAQLYSDYDILVLALKHTPDEAKEMLARNKIQKFEDLKLNIIAQNPTLLGVGVPGPNELEIGSEVGGPNPMLGIEQPQPEMVPPQQGGGLPPNSIGMRKYMDEEEMEIPDPSLDRNKPIAGSGIVLPEPSEEDIKRYNLDIKDFDKEMDEEEQDASEL